eukprot:scpid105371/ scgid4660/ 
MATWLSLHCCTVGKAKDQAATGAHRHCCGKAPKHGGTILGAARKKDSFDEANTTAAMPPVASAAAATATVETPKEPSPDQLGTGSKYPYRTDPIGYLQFIQHQANLLHTLQQHRMKTSSTGMATGESPTSDTEDDSDDDDDDDNEQEEGMEETAGKGDRQRTSTASVDKANDASSGENEDDSEDDDDDDDD